MPSSLLILPKDDNPEETEKRRIEINKACEEKRVEIDFNTKQMKGFGKARDFRRGK
jgi:hypothetical protein